MRFIIIMMTIFVLSGRLVTLAIAKPVAMRKADGMAIPLARHPSSSNLNRNIDLDEISSHGISIREKILLGLDNYERNTGTMHPFAVKRSEHGLSTRGTSVPLTTSSYQNNMWMGEISIGTPPKTLKVQIDTGSADMWVLETGCDEISAEDREFWDPHSSESAKNQRMSFRLQYSDGSIVKGDRYNDNVTIAGFTADPQTFGSVTSYSSSNSIYEYPADGLLGLAFPSVSKFGADPLFKSLVKQNKAINPTFSFKLSSSGAEMYVGGTNSMLYKGDIAYTPVTHPALWQVSIEDVRVNGDTIFEDVPAIIDTGSTYIFGGWEAVSELYEGLGATLKEYKGYGYYSLPCDSFPTVSFTFGGKTFEIPPEVLRIKPLWEGSPRCFSSIIAQRSPIVWVIGLTFLQGVYSVFDYSTLQVGLADLA